MTHSKLTLDYLDQNKSLIFLQHSALARAVLLLAGWLAVWFIGSLVEYTHHASVWFPPAGLTFAALFVVGWRAIPILMAAAILVTILTSENYQIQLQNFDVIKGGVLFGIAHIVPYCIGSKLLRWLTQTKQLTLPQSIISFLIIAAVSALLTSLLVISVLIFSNMMPASDFNTTWLPFWIGDMAGIIVLAPLFFSLMLLIYPKKRFAVLAHLDGSVLHPSPQYKYKVLIAFALVALAMLLAKFSHSRDSSFAIFFLVLPHMWIACTENAFFNILSLALSSLLVVFFVDILGLMDFVMVYQFAINVVAANAMFAISIPALTARNDQLKTKVFTDSLTLAASREHLIEQGEIEIHNAHWKHQPFCMLIFDLDYFKKINDVHGHDVGDYALRIVSEAVIQLLRPGDLLGRYGGDEFVVLLPETDSKNALSIGQRLLKKINEVPFVTNERLSVSIGISQMNHDDNFESLFKRTDEALYKAKRAGRNCLFQQ